MVPPNDALTIPAMLRSLVAISAGASMGAILRWWLSRLLNPLFPLIPFGTLTANLLGGYCIGIAVSLFSAMPDLSPEWRLLIITGFLGALTTFSTFSAELVALLTQQRITAALLLISMHVFGTVLMTFAGIGTVSLVRHCLR